MRKHSIALILIVGVVVFVSACFHRGPVYTESEELAVDDAGKKMAENWIREYWPEGEVRTIEPYVFMYGSGPHYLTDYSEGTLFDGEKERRFSINIVTGEIYVEPDEEIWDTFQKCVSEWYLESLDLPTDLEIAEYSASVSVSPIAANGSGNWADSVYLVTGLPGELVAQNKNVENYVRDPERKEIISVSGWITTPDETELSGYTLADRIRRQEKYGLEYSNFLLKNSFEKVTSLDYEHWEFREWEGRKVLFRDLYRREEQNENGEIVTTEKTPDLGQRASMKKTATGWRIDIDDTDGMVEFFVKVFFCE